MDIQIEPAGFSEQPIEGVPFDSLVVLMSEFAFDKIKAHALSRLDKETGGLLIGNVWENDGTMYVQVTETIPAKAQGTAATLWFTASDWIELEKEKARSFAAYKKVGWYHSHLDCGVFLSPPDKFLHATAFSLPWHIAFVYDPIRGEGGFFRWVEKELVSIPF